MERISFKRVVSHTIDPVKDASAARLKLSLLALIVGHSLFYVLWAVAIPQPYESLAYRTLCVALAAIGMLLAFRYPLTDRRVQAAYTVATFFGTAFCGAWMYFANQGEGVWLASLCVLIAIYYSATDWRIALAGTLLALLVSALLVPLFHVGLWSVNSNKAVLNSADLIILGFAIAAMTISRMVDENWRVVRMRAQLRALGIVAHELRTPLAGLQLLGTALEDRIAEKSRVATMRQDDWEELHDLVHEIVVQADSTHAMIATQLANANPWAPFSLRKSVFLAYELRESIEQFGRANVIAPGVIDLQVGEGVAHLTALVDPQIFRQILTNILSNALHAVRDHHKTTPKGSIRVGMRTVDSDIQILIRDMGPGIDPRDLPHIFKPFHTGKESYGHGLGLTFVRSALDAYGGTIDVETSVGQGATFIINFPRERK